MKPLQKGWLTSGLAEGRWAVRSSVRLWHGWTILMLRLHLRCSLHHLPQPVTHRTSRPHAERAWLPTGEGLLAKGGSNPVSSLGAYMAADCRPGWLQVSSVRISASFTVVQGQVSSLGWMFRQDTYSDNDQTVRACGVAIRPNPDPQPLPQTLSTKLEVAMHLLLNAQTSDALHASSRLSCHERVVQGLDS